MLGRSPTSDSIYDTDPPLGALGVSIHRSFFSWTFVLYLCSGIIVVGGFATLTVVLWSDMGRGLEAHGYLQTNTRHGYTVSVVVFVMLLVLYLFDFFWPPHLPGRFFVLSKSGHTSFTFCVIIGALGVLSAIYLSARDYPGVPLVLTNSLSPWCLMLLRRITMPTFSEKSSELVESPGLDDRVAKLKTLQREERDEQNFHTASICAFLLSAVLCLGIWVPWAIRDDDRFRHDMAVAVDQDARELLFVRWCAPIIVSVSSIFYASIAGLRLKLSHAYSATDKIKNQVALDNNGCTSKGLEHFRMQMLRSRVAAAHSQKDVLKASQDRLQPYLVRHIAHIRSLSKVVQAVVGTLLILILFIHIIFRLTTAVSHVAFMTESLFASYICTFIAFTFVSFSRVTKSMTFDLVKLPFLQSLLALRDHDAVRAFWICLTLPFVPAFLCLSFVNQRMRRLRGLTSGDKAKCWFTGRVQVCLMDMSDWSWVSITYWCYVMSTLLLLYRITPVFLNVFLAWLTYALGSLGFEATLIATFGIGVFLFMLPPVPGPIIYPFAGILISQKCPYGFWWGCVACCLICLLMKLVASAMQQKFVGERLGANVTVRRLVGVHKPFIRAIEIVMRKPGFSWGKCMILCGGPDWPVSVLAGILHLSLWQVMVGTCPIIVSVAPLVLTGSFYLRREENEIWVRTGNLMLSLTALVSAIMWVGICSAVQDELDRGKNALNAPKEEHVELEWHDHCIRVIDEKCSVPWHRVPRLVWALYAGGALGLTIVGHVMFWLSYSCFGTFRLNDDIRTLVWLGPDGLIRPTGFAVMSVAIISYFGLLVYYFWHRCHSRVPRKEAMRELDVAEELWKDAWMQKARQAATYAPSNIAGPCLLRQLSQRSVLAPDQSLKASAMTHAEPQFQPDSTKKGTLSSASHAKLSVPCGGAKFVQYGTDLSPNWHFSNHSENIDRDGVVEATDSVECVVRL